MQHGDRGQRIPAGWAPLIRGCRVRFFRTNYVLRPGPANFSVPKPKNFKRRKKKNPPKVTACSLCFRNNYIFQPGGDNRRQYSKVPGSPLHVNLQNVSVWGWDFLQCIPEGTTDGSIAAVWKLFFLLFFFSPPFWIQTLKSGAPSSNCTKPWLTTDSTQFLSLLHKRVNFTVH